MLQKNFFGPLEFLPSSEQAIKQKLMSNKLPSGEAFCRDMNSLPVPVKDKHVRFAGHDVQLYKHRIRAPIKRDRRRPEWLLKIIDRPRILPLRSEHLEQLDFFEIPMCNHRPMHQRKLFIAMRLRGIIDIEQELLDNLEEHVTKLQKLKNNSRTSALTIAMMEGEMLRQGHEVKTARWIKLKVMCELAIVQEEIDRSNADQPDS